MPSFTERFFPDFVGLNKKTVLIRAAVVAIPVLAMLVVQIVSSAAGLMLWRWGIRPLVPIGLVGIATAPFLHASWAHLGSNAPFALVLGFLISFRSLKDYFSVWLISQAIGGFGTWLIGGKGTYHAGASIVIMGMFATMIVRVFFDRCRNIFSLISGVVIILAYGGTLLWAFVPHKTAGGLDVSWQGHLCGFIGGLAAGIVLGVWYRYHPKKNRVAARDGDDDVEAELRSYPVGEQQTEDMMNKIYSDFN